MCGFGWSGFKQISRAIRLDDFIDLSKKVKTAKYFETLQEVAIFVLTLTLVAMLPCEPIPFCFEYADGNLFTDLCSEGSKMKLLKRANVETHLIKRSVMSLCPMSERLSTKAQNGEDSEVSMSKKTATKK